MATEALIKAAEAAVRMLEDLNSAYGSETVQAVADNLRNALPKAGAYQNKADYFAHTPLHIDSDTGDVSVGVNGLTEEETQATASVMGLVGKPAEDFRSQAEEYGDAIKEALHNYRLSSMVTEDGDGWRLVDALTTRGEVEVSSGVLEVELLTDHIWFAIHEMLQRRAVGKGKHTLCTLRACQGELT